MALPLPPGVTVAEDAWRIDAGDDSHYGVLIRVRTITGNPYWWLICPADATLYLQQLPEAMLDCHSDTCAWQGVHEKAAAVIAGHLLAESRS